MLISLMTCFVGCGDNTVHDKVVPSPIDKGERGIDKRHDGREGKEDEKEGENRNSVLDGRDEEIEASLNLISNSQSHFEILYVRHHFLEKLSNRLLYAKGGSLYERYIDRYLDAAFEVPIDAADVGTRTRQFNSFCLITDSAVHCAEVCDDFNRFWDYSFRRLGRIQDEIRRVEAYCAGMGDPKTFTGDRDDWKDYRNRVKGEYARNINGLSRMFGSLQTADFLTYERWLITRTRLEEKLGHKVKVWDIVLEKWRKMRGKESQAGITVIHASKNSGEGEKTTAEMETKFLSIPNDVCTNWVKASGDVYRMNRRIMTLSPALSERCARKMVQAILSVPIDRLNYDDRSHVLDAMWDMVADVGWREIRMKGVWELRLLRLSHLSKAIECVRKGQGDQAASRFITVMSERFNSYAQLYELELANRTAKAISPQDLADLVDELPNNEYTAIKGEFEKILGRPIRTYEEIVRTQRKCDKPMDLEEECQRGGPDVRGDVGGL